MRAQPRQLVQKRLTTSARVGRSRPELAAELVRLEYERTRLERSLGAIESRRSTFLDQLRVLRERAGWIQNQLNEAPCEANALPQPPPTKPQRALGLQAAKPMKRA